MKNREKAPERSIEVSQFAELAACVSKQLPRDIKSYVAQEWIRNPLMLSRALRNALCTSSVLARASASGFLDTSFDGREVHHLVIRPLTEKQALDEYRKSGGNTQVSDNLIKNMTYTMPTADTLDVMILNFGYWEEINYAITGMKNLGIRGLSYEEIIQYGISYPKHQKQIILAGHAAMIDPVDFPYFPALGFENGVRGLFGISSSSHIRFLGVSEIGLHL